MNREPIDRGEHHRGKREKHRLVTGNTGTTHRLSSYSSLPSCPSLFSFIVSDCIDFVSRDASESFDSSFFEEGSTRRRISINFRSEISVSLGDGFLRGDLSWKYSQGLSSFFPNRIERGESLNPVNFPPIFPILFPEYRVSS